MKIGSLVVCLPFKPHRKFLHLITWLPLGDETTIYTVRDIGEGKNFNGKTTIIRLQEGIMGFNDFGEELGMNIDYFREVQSPDDLEAILEALKEEVVCSID